MAINDLWSGWLTDNPSAAYFSNAGQWKTPNQKKYFQSQFSNIQDQYMGKLGQMVQGGGAPSLEFTDFLKNFNWGQNFQQNAPQSMTQNSSQFNPWARWMV